MARGLRKAADMHLASPARPRTSATPAPGAPVDRERAATTRLTTVARLCLAAGLLLAACGGSKRADHYAAATSAQERCCEKASDRDTCLQQIVRAPDAEVAGTPVAQASYACVQEHFECDELTGRATAASAQAQLDCIQELPQ